MDGATVLITGGNAGLGLATARGLARRGARVVLTARDPAKGAAAAVDVRAAAPEGDGRGARPRPGELRVDPARCRGGATAVDRLDVLVNNAGLS